MPKIHVQLKDEGVDVWRPVVAERVAGAIFTIDPRATVADGEAWTFGPGERVLCEWRKFSNGDGLVALRVAD